jgi:hypothetical protein
MELCVNQGFSLLSQDEMMAVDGGGAKEGAQAFCGIILIAVTPIALCINPIAGAATGLIGAGLFGNATGLY